MNDLYKSFETWLSLKYGGSRLGMWMKENGEYGVPSVQLRWEAWQASRTAIEIEIPEVCAWNLCELLDKKEVIEAIRAAGIKVKE